MTNKKGFSILKIILVILFISVIYVLLSSCYSALRKKPNTTTLDNNQTDVIKAIAPVDYNPLNDVSDFNMAIYNYTDFMYNNTTFINNNWLAFSDTTLVYYYSDNIQNNLIMPTTNFSLAKSYPVSVTDSYYLPISSYYYGVNTNLSKTFFTNNKCSQAMLFNCNIPIEYFNFNFVYNISTSVSSSHIRFMYLTDTMTMHYYDFTIVNGQVNYPFNCVTALNGSDNTATNIIRFGFGVLQDAASTNRDKYLPQYNGSTNTSGINYESNAVFKQFYRYDINQFGMEFNIPIYSDAYRNGYDDGVNATTKEYTSIVNDLNNRVFTLSSSITELQATITSQSSIISHLNEQLNQSNLNFKGLFMTIADVPFRTVSNMLGFEVLGLNLFQFFTGVLTALGMIWLVKKFI